MAHKKKGLFLFYDTLNDKTNLTLAEKMFAIIVLRVHRFAIIAGAV